MKKTLIALLSLLLCGNLFVFYFFVLHSELGHPHLEGDWLEASRNGTRTQLTFPHPYTFTIPNSDLCSRTFEGKEPKLSVLILVCTAVHNFETRQVIRETWGSVASSNNNTGPVRLGFLLGSTRNSSMQMLVENEYRERFDVIQENFVDSYQNLTIKSVMLLKWVTNYCPNVHFVVKTDDDTYLNVERLTRALSEVSVKSNVMYGVLFHNARPNRNPTNKWHVPENQFPGNIYPDYLSGTGYVISRDVVPLLLDVSYSVPFIAMEDIFITGLCANRVGVKRYNLSGFDYTKRKSTGCAFKNAITGHRVSIKEMIKIWKELNDPKLKCGYKLRWT